MSRAYKLLCGAAFLSAAINAAQADNTTTTLMSPVLQGNYTGWFAPTAAYNVLGEVGVNNYRLNLTAGTLLNDQNRIKLSAEYLRQNIKYQFLSGTTQQWLQQYAVGGGYQYGVCDDFKCFVGLNAYASHAPSKSLNPRDVIINVAGTPTPFFDNRHIAGSNAYNISPGIGFNVWQGGTLGLNLNYDNVRYNQIYSSDQIVSGFGGTIRLNQALTDQVGLGVKATVGQPFNNYEATLKWLNAFYNGRVSLGLFAAYTDGKEGLPNTLNAGLSVNFADCNPVVVAPLKTNYKGEVDSEFCLPSGQYVMVPNAYTAPQMLASRPLQLGPKLPIVNAKFK